MTLRMIRIKEKLNTMFEGKIDLSDCTTNAVEREKTFLSRSVAALSIMLTCGIDAEVSGACITDGGQDLGIDAIYCDDNQKELILVQSKWNATGNKTIELGDLLKFISGVKRLISLNFENANPKIKYHKSSVDRAIRAMDYQIKILVSHTGKQNISRVCMQAIQELLDGINDDTNELLKFTEINQNLIYEYLASGQLGDNINIEDILLHNWGAIDVPYRAYYGTVNAAQVAEWYATYDKKLYNKNIRYYKGSTDVNDSIRKVLKDNPTDFIYFNNGIKALSTKISRKAAKSTDNKVGIFAVEGFSIVNGAQTTGCIGTAFKEFPGQVAKASVFIQLIDLEDTPPGYASQITQLSNTQNRIENKDFAALDPEQERLFKELSFESIEYLYKAGSSVREPDKQVAIDEALIALACYQDEVSLCVTAKSNFGTLVENINKAPYRTLFNSNTSSYLLWNAVRTYREVEKIISKREIGKQGRERLALVHGNRFILHMVFYLLKSRGVDFGTCLLSTEKITNECKDTCQMVIPLQFEIMNELLPEAYPAHIFKNVTRTKSIRAGIIKRMEFGFPNHSIPVKNGKSKKRDA